jgi:hypothetical protein
VQELGNEATADVAAAEVNGLPSQYLARRNRRGKLTFFS